MYKELLDELNSLNLSPEELETLAAEILPQLSKEASAEAIYNDTADILAQEAGMEILAGLTLNITYGTPDAAAKSFEVMASILPSEAIEKFASYMIQFITKEAGEMADQEKVASEEFQLEKEALVGEALEFLGQYGKSALSALKDTGSAIKGVADVAKARGANPIAAVGQGLLSDTKDFALQHPLATAGGAILGANALTNNTPTQPVQQHQPKVAGVVALDMEKMAAKLNSEERNSLPDSDFVFPKERRYPIHDISHARAALRFAAGTADEATVRRAVHAKYPGIDQQEKAAATQLEQLDNAKEEGGFAGGVAGGAILGTAGVLHGKSLSGMAGKGLLGVLAGQSFGRHVGAKALEDRTRKRLEEEQRKKHKKEASEATGITKAIASVADDIAVAGKKKDDNKESQGEQ